MVNGLWRDVLHAVRSLLRARAFTAVCVISLGIGMTPVIAIPYVSRLSNAKPAIVDTEKLVELLTIASGPHQAGERWSYPDYLDMRATDMGMDVLGWIGSPTEVMSAPGGAKTQASTLYVSGNYFDIIGIKPVRGPGFTRASDASAREKSEPEVIVGYDYWRDRMQSDPSAVGKTMILDGVPHVIVGVAPERFFGHMNWFTGWEFYAPLEWHPRLRPNLAPDKSDRDNRGKEWINLHAQLKPGITVAQASAVVTSVTARLAQAHPETNEHRSGVAGPYDPVGSMQRRQFRTLQLVGFTLTGMVLLVVSLNISGMMQVRSAMRERELSIRQAIGATRARLARYLLSEAIVLACAGGTIASLIIFNLPAVISRLSGQAIPESIAQALKVDWYVIAVNFALCLLTSLIFGWLPAMRFSRPAILSSLKDDAGGGGLRVGRVHRVTAALQVAIAVPLLVMSGQSLDRMRATAANDLGFAAESVYAVPLKLDQLTSADAASQMRRSKDALSGASGVVSVTAADGLPLDFRYRMTRASLKPEPNAAPRFIATHVTRVADGFLDTLGISLVSGRAFSADDRLGAEPVTIVSKPLADKLAPNGHVIGKQLLFGSDEKTQKTLTIIGVTGDFPTSQMSTEREQLLLPLAQYPGISWDAVPVSDDRGNAPRLMLIARSAPGEPAQKLTTALESIARELDKEFQPSSIVTGKWLRERSMDDFMTQSLVAAAAGGVILLLAALGIYGVVGLMVATRTRELAVRSALGASRVRVLVMVITDVVKLVSPGVVVGVLLTIVLNRLNAENMGVALSDAEPLAYAVGALVAVLVAVLASLAPARRAASVPPMVAMRAE